MENLIEINVLLHFRGNSLQWGSKIINTLEIQSIDPCEYGSLITLKGEMSFICNVHYELWRTIIRANHQGKEVGRDQ